MAGFGSKAVAALRLRSASGAALPNVEFGRCRGRNRLFAVGRSRGHGPTRLNCRTVRPQSPSSSDGQGIGHGIAEIEPLAVIPRCVSFRVFERGGRLTLDPQTVARYSNLLTACYLNAGRLRSRALTSCCTALPTEVGRSSRYYPCRRWWLGWRRCPVSGSSERSRLWDACWPRRQVNTRLAGSRGRWLPLPDQDGGTGCKCESTAVRDSAGALPNGVRTRKGILLPRPVLLDRIRRTIRWGELDYQSPRINFDGDLCTATEAGLLLDPTTG